MTPPAHAPRILSVLCITKCEPHARRFLYDFWNVVSVLPFPAELVVYCDVTVDVTEPTLLTDIVTAWHPVNGNFIRVIPSTGRSGFLEAMHDDAVRCCDGQYVLRLDDDERMNHEMKLWIYNNGFLEQDHWKFDRAHLWGSDDRYIPAAPLWPDHQTRLSSKAKAGGRGVIHAGSPHGGGTLAPGCVIEHHCFLVRSQEARLAKVQRYDRISAGSGTSFLPFHMPEVHYGYVATSPYSSERHPDADY